MRKIHPEDGDAMSLLPQTDRDNIYRCLQNLGSHQGHLISLRQEVKGKEIYDSIPNMLSTEMIEAVLPEADDHDSVNSDTEDKHGNKGLTNLRNTYSK